MVGKNNIQKCCSQCTINLVVTWQWIKKKKELLQQRYLTHNVGAMPSLPLLRFLNQSRHNIPPVSVLRSRAARKRKLSVSLHLNVADRTDITIQNGTFLTLWNAQPLESNNPGTTKLSWRTQHISHKVLTRCAIHRCHEEYNEMWLFQ